MRIGMSGGREWPGVAKDGRMAGHEQNCSDIRASNANSPAKNISTCEKRSRKNPNDSPRPCFPALSHLLFSWSFWSETVWPKARFWVHCPYIFLGPSILNVKNHTSKLRKAFCVVSSSSTLLKLFMNHPTFTPHSPKNTSGNTRYTAHLLDMSKAWSRRTYHTRAYKAFSHFVEPFSACVCMPDTGLAEEVFYFYKIFPPVELSWIPCRNQTPCKLKLYHRTY